MRQSESIANLAAALVKVQPNLIHPKKNAKNPHLRNKFADLGSVIDANREPLAAAGLAILQTTTSYSLDGDHYIGVATRLIHESGEWIEGSQSLPLAEQKGLNLAQVAGSTDTYLRRYGWQTILGLNGEPDDDGNEGGGDKTSDTSRTADDLL